MAHVEVAQPAKGHNNTDLELHRARVARVIVVLKHTPKLQDMPGRAQRGDTFVCVRTLGLLPRFLFFFGRIFRIPGAVRQKFVLGNTALTHVVVARDVTANNSTEFQHVCTNAARVVVISKQAVLVQEMPRKAKRRNTLVVGILMLDINHLFVFPVLSCT